MHTTPKILFISPQPFMADRGSPLRVSRTLESLVRLGFEIDFLCYPLGKDVSIPGVTIHRSWGIPGVSNIHIGPSWTKFGYDLMLFAKALWLAYKNDYNAIHAVEEAALVASLIGRVQNKKYVVDMHSAMQDELIKSRYLGSKPFLAFFNTLEHWWIRGAAGALTVCNRLTTYARRLAPGIAAYTGHDIPLPGLKNYNQSDLEQLRARYELQDKRVLLYTGNFQSYQGVELLVRAFALFCTRQQSPSASTPNNVVLVLVGGGGENSEERANLETLVRQLSIQPYVRFIEQRPASEMPTFQALGDVLASPRLTGCNTPLKVYSYLAANKPMIATNIESHTQVIDESAAYLCDPTPLSMADSIEKAFSESEQEIANRQAIISNALSLIENKYNEETFFQAIQSIYADIIDQPYVQEQRVANA